MLHHFSGWDSLEEMASDFAESVESLPTIEEIIFADYEQGSYDGSAFVLYVHAGRLYEVHASHCSYYGLEGLWDPEETTVEALRLRPLRDLTWAFGMEKDAILARIQDRLGSG